MELTTLQEFAGTLAKTCQQLFLVSARLYSKERWWIAQWQLRGATWRACQRGATHLKSSAVKIGGLLIKNWLNLLRLLAVLLTFTAGELRYAEPDSWPGRLFTSRLDSAIVGYKTLLEKQSLTPQDQGFPEILELALSNEHRVPATIAKEYLGSIETITMGGHSPLGKSQGFSTAEDPFRAPFNVGLADQHGKSVRAHLGYKERDLKEQFFMPGLRSWGVIIFRAGIAISLLLWLPAFRGR
jgi:hypothetical protein